MYVQSHRFNPDSFGVYKGTPFQNPIAVIQNGETEEEAEAEKVGAGLVDEGHTSKLNSND